MLYFANFKNDRFNNFFQTESEDFEMTKRYDYMMARYRDEKGIDKSRAVHDDHLPLFVSSDMAFADMDDGITIEDFKKNFSNIEYFLVTSKNHQKEKNGKTCDRYHLLFPLSKTYENEAEYAALLEKIIEVFETDPACKNPNRIFFGSPSDARTHENHGTPVNVFLSLIDGEAVEEHGIKADYTPPEGRIAEGGIPDLVRFAGSIRRQYLHDDAGLERAMKEHADKYYIDFPERSFKRVLKSALKYNKQALNDKIKKGKRYELNDIGDAQYLSDYLVSYRWCEEKKGWMHFEKGVWKKDYRLCIRESVKRLVIRRLKDVKHISGEEEQRVFIKHVGKLCNHTVRERILRDTQSLKSILADDFDTHDYLLNCKNGTLDLKTFDFYEHKKDEYHSKIANVDYVKEEKTPELFLKFVDTTFEGNEELIRYVQKIMGFALTGDAGLQEFYIFWGKGGNGKSQLIGVLRQILGDYAYGISAKQIMESKYNGNASTYLAQLRGIRALFCSEGNDAGRLDLALVKQLTDEDQPLNVAQKYEVAQQFTLKLHPFLITNPLPKISETLDATWRRIKLIPFTHKVPDEERVPYLAEKMIAAGRSGILNWFLDGLRAYYAEGMKPPVIVEQRSNEYRSREDEIQSFLDECCEIDSEGEVQTVVLHEAWKKWSGKKYSHPRIFIPLIEERGYEKRKREGRAVFMGLKLLDTGEKNPFDEA
jgi:P4 family phage/plasmid primase-like protien